MAKKSNKKIWIVAIAVPVLLFLSVAAWYLHHINIPVMNPAGEIARKERNLILFTLGLVSIVVVPVYVMAIAIALKYRESNHERKRVKYRPDWDGSKLFESLWWGIPFLIIGILSVVTWNSSHALDPSKPLDSNQNTMKIQVIALDWKWLFIYPWGVASVNEVVLPKDQPVDFQITSDSVMNSFWIPQLGGQIYAMPGMTTHLHLNADKVGNYFGSPANIAGSGYARMDFNAKVVSYGDFGKWLITAEQSQNFLSLDAYQKLKKPSDNYPVTYYWGVYPNLYNSVVLKYMEPKGSHYMVMPE